MTNHLNVTGITDNNDNIYEAIRELTLLEGGHIFFPMILIVFSIILFGSLSTRYSTESSLMSTFFMGSIISFMLVTAGLLSIQIMVVYISLTGLLGFVAIMRR